VINGWGDFEIVNRQKILSVLRHWNPDHVHVFSFAIHDEDNRDRFNKWCRPHIERAIGRQFELVPTVDGDITAACAAQMRLHPSTVTFRDLIDFWGKGRAFEDFARIHFANTHKHGIATQLMFLDDAVMNKEFSFPDLNITGSILNIDQLV
jgi:hypothetical protein